MDVRYEIDKFMSNKVWPRLAAMVPHRLVHWVLIRAGVKTIGHSEVVPEVPFTVVLQRWGVRP